MAKPKALNHRDYLTLLAKSKSKRRRKALIDLADKKEIDAICEIVLNLLNGRLRVPRNVHSSLKRHKNELRILAKKTPPVKLKKHILVQKGGFLPHLLPLALNLIPSILGAVAK